MTVGGQKIIYGRSPRQYVEVYPCSAVDGGGSNNISQSPCPLIIFLHGGGWYSGSTTDHEDLAKYISSHSRTAVALIEYRLTPKESAKLASDAGTSNDGLGFHHPDHINDVHCALEMLFDEKTSMKYKYDTSKVIFVGHSVGGWMVLSAALASETGQSKFEGPIRDIPPLQASIRHSLKAFVAVESIFSVVGLVRLYPEYTSFIIPALYPAKEQASPPYSALEKAGVEAWSLAPGHCYSNGSKPNIYVIHSSEDDLLSAEYNAEGIALLQEKGLKPIIDLTSFKGDHDALLHTQAFWQRLIDIVEQETVF